MLISISIKYMWKGNSVYEGNCVIKNRNFFASVLYLWSLQVASPEYNCRSFGRRLKSKVIQFWGQLGPWVGPIWALINMHGVDTIQAPLTQQDYGVQLLGFVSRVPPSGFRHTWLVRVNTGMMRLWASVGLYLGWLLLVGPDDIWVVILGVGWGCSVKE